MDLRAALGSLATAQLVSKTSEVKTLLAQFRVVRAGMHEPLCIGTKVEVRVGANSYRHGEIVDGDGSMPTVKFVGAHDLSVTEEKKVPAHSVRPTLNVAELRHLIRQAEEEGADQAAIDEARVVLVRGL